MARFFYWRRETINTSITYYQSIRAKSHPSGQEERDRESRKSFLSERHLNEDLNKKSKPPRVHQGRAVQAKDSLTACQVRVVPPPLLVSVLTPF